MCYVYRANELAWKTDPVAYKLAIKLQEAIRWLDHLKDPSVAEHVDYPLSDEVIEKMVDFYGMFQIRRFN